MATLSSPAAPSTLHVPAPPHVHRLPNVGRHAGTLALLAVLVVALLAGVPGLGPVLDGVGRIGPGWILLASVLEIASSLSFVVLFRHVFDRLPGREARSLAWTEMASGALLPAGGAGGMAIGGWLMHLAGAPTHWVVRRSSALFLLSGAASSAALIVAGMALIAGAPGPHDFARAGLPVVIALPGTLLIAALPLVLRYSRHSPRVLTAVSTAAREAEQLIVRRPRWRLAGAAGYLLFDIAVLWVLLRAVGSRPSAPALVMGYSIGYIANTLPVPGGIGVLDAGLTGALAAYGVAPVHAAAAVLMYHAIALWIPGLGGVFAYSRVRARIVAQSGHA